MAEAHSEWGASKFHQIMLCPGSKVLQAGLPNRSSKYAAEGTAAHSLLEMCLRTGSDAERFRGQILQADGMEFEVDDDMISHIQWTIDTVREYVGNDGVLMAEQRVHYHGYLNVEEGTGFGTADVVIIRGEELIVMDLKYGRGEEVSAERNPQLMLYALGTLAAHQGLSGDFTKVRVVILQPRISKRPDEWDCSVEELEAWGYSTARSAVCTARNATDSVQDDVWRETYLRPGEKQCLWCKAKATCPTLRNDVAETVSGFAPADPDEFADMAVVNDENRDAAWLAACLSKVDLIEDWCKAVRGEVERRLLAGEPVPGYKLVQGKQGNRAWADKAEAEAALKAMRLKVEEMYDFSLISPTKAEKVLAENPRRWAKLQPMITRGEGKPHVAPLSDKRPALEIKPVADSFTNLDDGQDLT